MQNTQAINVTAGNATATGSVTVSDGMPGVPCPDPAGYKYVGARYVPLFADPAEWNINSTYEPLTIVLHEGNSYTSRQHVPAGIQIDNEEYWALTGNYNAQVEQYRQEVKALGEELAKHLKVYLNVNSMVSDQPNLGKVVKTLGYYSEGDGGSTIYIISQNAGKYSIAVGNYYAVPVFSGEVKPEQFGAKGDKNSDDTTALQTMFDNAGSNIVTFSPKTYIINKTLTINSKVIIEGNSAAIRTLTEDFIMLNMGPDAYASVINNLKLRFSNDLTEETSSYKTPSCTGIVAAPTSKGDVDYTLNNVVFFNLVNGFKYAGRNVEFVKCIFSLTTNPIIVEKAPAGDTRGLVVRECRFHASANYSVCIVLPSADVETNNYITSNYFDYCGGIIKGGLYGLTFNNNKIWRSSYGMNVIEDTDETIQINAYGGTSIVSNRISTANAPTIITLNQNECLVSGNIIGTTDSDTAFKIGGSNCLITNNIINSQTANVKLIESTGTNVVLDGNYPLTNVNTVNMASGKLIGNTNTSGSITTRSFNFTKTDVDIKKGTVINTSSNKIIVYGNGANIIVECPPTAGRTSGIGFVSNTYYYVMAQWVNNQITFEEVKMFNYSNNAWTDATMSGYYETNNKGFIE